MKKISMLYMLLIFFFVSCTKDDANVIQEPGVLKTIEFNISQNGDYTNPIFNSIQAELKLTVSKENILSGQNTRLWDTTFAMRPIREYPPIQTPTIILKQFDEIKESFENIRVSRVIRYLDGLNQTWMDAKGESANFSRPIASFQVRI
jgi:hypothetical protein